MPDLKEIILLPVENEIHTCPDCGYERGFHTSFVRAGARGDNPVKTAREAFRVILICPECGARFDGGWRVPLNEFESRVDKAPLQSPSCVPHGSPAACRSPQPHDNHPPE